jgi:hypothetical protein
MAFKFLKSTKNIIIIFLLMVIFGLGIALGMNKCNCSTNTNTNTNTNTKKNDKWPDYDKDHPFSIQLRGTKYCLHPKGDSTTPENGANLVLNEGCDENQFRYKVFPDGQIQHYKHIDSKTDKIIGGKCLHPKEGTNQKSAKDNDEIVFKDICDDSWPTNTPDTLRYTYENGKIKNKKSGLCLNADSNAINSVIRLKDCKNASDFDLV